MLVFYLYMASIQINTFVINYNTTKGVEITEYFLADKQLSLM